MLKAHLHNVEKHNPGPAPGFEMRVTGVFGGDATKRQVRESVLIQQTEEEKLINRRDEWRQVKLPRILLSLSYIAFREPGPLPAPDPVTP